MDRTDYGIYAPEVERDLSENYTSDRLIRQPRIETRCPSCGHVTLFVGNGGHLTCSWLKCPRPSLADWIEDMQDTVRRLGDLVREQS